MEVERTPRVTLAGRIQMVKTEAQRMHVAIADIYIYLCPGPLAGSGQSLDHMASLSLRTRYPMLTQERRPDGTGFAYLDLRHRVGNRGRQSDPPPLGTRGFSRLGPRSATHGGWCTEFLGRMGHGPETSKNRADGTPNRSTRRGDPGAMPNASPPGVRPPLERPMPCLPLSSPRISGDLEETRSSTVHPNPGGYSC